MSRYILFICNNIKKTQEIAKQFDRYNVQVIPVNWIYNYKCKYNEQQDPDHFATIEERTTLSTSDNRLLDYEQLKESDHQLLPVQHNSVLEYTVYNKNNSVSQGSITHKVTGHIDFRKKLSPSVSSVSCVSSTDKSTEKVFGFDDIFVLDELFKSYHELKQEDVKICARDHCVSEFIKMFLYRKSLGDWKFNPQKQETPISFEKDPSDVFVNNSCINNITKSNPAIMNMITHVLNNGVFYRASKNRRQSLYWYPGLNSGIPYVKKPKDEIQELTYFIHDVAHQAIPDLIFTGALDKVSKFVYTAYRLMSEATTLVVADMFFVSCLLEAGYKYETVENRKIYPMFESMNINIQCKETFYKLLHASMEFCLLGDPSGFQSFNPDPKLLQEFVSKYEKFFIQDYRWTDHNLKDMSTRPDSYNRWFSTVRMWAPHINNNSNSNNNSMLTVTDFTNMLPNIYNMIYSKDYRSACNLIYDKMLELYIKPAFHNINNNNTKLELDPLNMRFDRMFRKYMIGQSYAFFRYPLENISEPYTDCINSVLSKQELVSLEQASAVHSFYKTYLERLRKLSIITDDDFTTYEWIFPLFKPMILSYDDELKESHQAFAYRILDGEN